MGIDRIGKNDPPTPPPAETIGGHPVGRTGHPFEVTSPRATPAPPETGALEAPRTALERLRAGEIDLTGYLDAKVDEATAHLSSLPVPELDAIRNALRDRMASDPTLVELVRAVTGHLPEPSAEDE